MPWQRGPPHCLDECTRTGTHTHINIDRSKDVHRHNPLGAGAENETAHLFTEFILPVFLDSLFMNLSICMTLQQHIEFGCFPACFPICQFLCVCLPVWPYKASVAHQNMSAVQTPSPSSSLFLFYSVSHLSYLFHQTSSFNSLIFHSISKTF